MIRKQIESLLEAIEKNPLDLTSKTEVETLIGWGKAIPERRNEFLIYERQYNEIIKQHEVTLHGYFNLTGEKMEAECQQKH